VSFFAPAICQIAAILVASRLFSSFSEKTVRKKLASLDAAP